MVSPYKQSVLEYGDSFSLIPLRKKSKRPFIDAWTKYCRIKPTEIEMNIWLAKYPDYNVGVCTGQASNLIGLDFDYDVGGLHAQILKLLPPPIAEKVGSKGSTLFFNYNGEESRKWVLNGQTILELLSNGRQSVIPPSIHPDGPVYVWKTAPNGLKAALPADFIKNVDHIFKRADAMQQRPREYSALDKNNTTNALEYISSDPYDAWISVGMCLKEVFKIDGLYMWNMWSLESKKYPGFDEIEKRWHSFKGKGKGLGTLIRMAQIDGFKPEFAPPPPLEKQKGGNLWPIPKTHRFDLRAGTALDDEFVPPIDWIFEDFLKPRTWAILAAKTKQGKSYLIEQIGIHAAAGLNFLGFHCNRPYRTVYIQKENTKTDITERSQAMFDEIRETKKLKLDYFFELTLPPNKFFIEDPEWLYQVQAETQAEIIIIDPWGRFSRTNENEKEGIAKLVDLLELFVQKTGCCLFISHHVKKQEDDEKMITFQDIRGSTHLPASSHANFIMNRRSKLPSKVGISERHKTYLKISAELRYESDFDAMWLWRDREKTLWHPVSQKVVSLGESNIDIVTFVKENPNCTSTEIIEAFNAMCSQRTIERQLKKVKNRRQIKEAPNSSRQKRSWIAI